MDIRISSESGFAHILQLLSQPVNLESRKQLNWWDIFKLTWEMPMRHTKMHFAQKLQEATTTEGVKFSAEINSTIFEYSIIRISMHLHNLMFHVSRSHSMVNSRPLRSPVWKIEIVGEKKVRCKLYVPPATTTLAYHGGTTSV